MPHDGWSTRYLLLLAVAIEVARAQFPFGDPPPAGPPPGMGALAGEMKVIQEARGLDELLDSDIVSLVMFTEGEDETNESRWFLLFQMMVEKSINVAHGDARVNWAQVSNELLRKSAVHQHQVRSVGIWLYCDANDRHHGVKLPMSVQSEEAVREAGTFILGALAMAKAQTVEGVWRKHRQLRESENAFKGEL